MTATARQSRVVLDTVNPITILVFTMKQYAPTLLPLLSPFLQQNQKQFHHPADHHQSHHHRQNLE